jgi:hypothetical protein
MYWKSKDCPAVAIYRGTMFSDELVYRNPTEREISNDACLHPLSGKGGCRSLDKALSDTSFPGNCRSLCHGEPKAAVIDSFCKGTVAELETPYRLNFIQGTLTPDKSRQINTFKELCKSVCFRTDSVDSRTNHALKSVSAALLTRGDISIVKECQTPGRPLNLLHTTNQNIFISKHNTNLPFHPEVATALGSHEINKIIGQTNSALKHLTAQVQKQMCDIELRQCQKLISKAKRQPSKTIFRARGKMITSRGSLLAIRHCKVTRAHTRSTPLCYIDQPVTFKGRALFR